MVRTLIEGNNVLPVLENLLGGERNVDGEAVATCSLPAGLANPTASDFVETSSRDRALVTAQGEDNGGNVFGLEGLDKLFGEDGSGHGGTSIWCNGVDIDSVLVTFDGQSAREAKNTAFLNKYNQYGVMQLELCILLTAAA